MNFLRDTAMFIIAVLIVVIALLMIFYFIGICAGAAHLGYEWAIS